MNNRRFHLTTCTLALLLALPAFGQAPTARLQFNLDHLADKAEQTVNVTLDKSLLELAKKFLPKNDPKMDKIGRIVSGLEGVYVRVFEFGKPGQYLQSDIDNIRKQLRAPGWNCIVEVRSGREKGENVDVCLRQDGDKILGLGVLAAEANELTVVNIVGNIRPEDFADLQGSFNIPHLQGLGRQLEKNKAVPRVETRDEKPKKDEYEE